MIVSPIMFFVALPVPGFFIMLLIVFIVLYRKNKNQNNIETIGTNNKIVKTLGLFFGVVYVIWFHFVVPFSPIGLDSMNCLSFPCEGTSYIDIVLDSAPTFLGLNISEDNKIYNEGTKNENISSCFDLKDASQQYDCVRQILSKTQNPDVCSELNSKKDIYKINHTDVKFCYYNVATRTDNPEVCNLITEDLVGKFDGSLDYLRNGCLRKFVEMSHEGGKFTSDKVISSCGMMKNNDISKTHCYAFIGYIKRDLNICNEVIANTVNSKENDDYKSMCVAEYYQWMYGQRLISLDDYENACKDIDYVPSKNKCLLTILVDRKDVSYCDYLEEIKNPQLYSEKLGLEGLGVRDNCLNTYNLIKDSQY